MTAGYARSKLLFLLGLAAFSLCWPHASLADASAHFPATPGRWWYYSTAATILEEAHVQRLFVANVANDGQTLIQRRQGGWDHFYSLGRKGILHKSYIDRHGGRAREAEALLLPATLAVGQSWTFDSQLRLIESRTFSAEDRLGGRYHPVPMTAEVKALNDTIEVPGGRFHGCIRVEAKGAALVRADRGSVEVEVRAAQTEWYAPGVGLVRVTRKETSESPFLRNGEYVQELLDSGT